MERLSQTTQTSVLLVDMASLSHRIHLSEPVDDDKTGEDIAKLSTLTIMQAKFASVVIAAVYASSVASAAPLFGLGGLFGGGHSGSGNFTISENINPTSILSDITGHHTESFSDLPGFLSSLIATPTASGSGAPFPTGIDDLEDDLNLSNLPGEISSIIGDITSELGGKFPGGFTGGLGSLSDIFTATDSLTDIIPTFTFSTPTITPTVTPSFTASDVGVTVSVGAGEQ
ncbi:hypothetical protein F5880DRAFT_1244061 [Lentinula raphanica]|nr:hypothetical protein F5880DRAFT_1244061 [Lentinula raphanica]